MTNDPKRPPRTGTPPDVGPPPPPELLLRQGVKPRAVRSWWVKALGLLIVAAMVAIAYAVSR